MAAQQFNYEMSQKSHVFDRDAVWMAAALMNFLVYYAVETQNPEEVWPLSSPNSDVPWLPMLKGMRTIWQIAGPDLAHSLFFKPTKDWSERCLGLPPTKAGIEGVSQILVEICGLDESSNAENNPYHTAAHRLSTLLNNPSAHPRSIKFLGFVNSIDAGFEDLLRRKDPRSLLLMAIWYGLVPESAWWISLRASLERRAVCIYLVRHHADDPLISNILTSL